MPFQPITFFMEITKQHIQILTEEFSRRVGRNSNYSLRGFAKALGMDITALSQILSGKRLLSFKKAEKILEVIDLSPEDKETFLWGLAKSHEQRNKKRLSPSVKKILSETKAKPSTVRDLSHTHFAIISDWYHYAILEMTFIEGFKSESQWISKRLGISKLEVNHAIKRLLELELLEWKNDQLIKTNQQLMTSDRHLSNSGLKKRQKQVIEKSLFSLENDPLEKRNHTAMTFAIDPSLIPEAKKRINQFMNELTDFLESGSRKNVYELTINLFPLGKENL